MRGKTVVFLIAVAAIAMSAFTTASAAAGANTSARMKKMLDAGLCKEIGANEKVPDTCSAYYGQCYFKKYPISDSNCSDKDHSNRPLVLRDGKCVPVSLAEIRRNGDGYLINQTSCGNENSNPGLTACKTWGRSYLGKLRGCQARMYWKEIYYCVQSYCGEYGNYGRGVYWGDKTNYTKGDIGDSYCEKEEYEMGYYYYITAHPAEMQLTCKSEEVWKRSKDK